MTDSKKIEGELYIATYGSSEERDFSKRNQIWKEIRDNKELLLDAIQVIRNKWNDGDTLKSLAISEAILTSAVTEDKAPDEIYKKLAEEVFSNKDIARIALTAPGFGDQGNSFLLICLWKEDFHLTEAQKQFVVSEAKEKVNNNITHGYGEYDIRYYILKNENMLLVDSGGQYLYGTTDITRTIVLGPINEKEKHCFTLALKSHINLASAKFLNNTYHS